MKMQQIIETFKRNISEVRNTVAADVNEIVFGYISAGSDWNKFANGEEAQEGLDARKEQLTPDQYEEQVGRAHAMHQAVLEWGAENGWSGEITRVWWTARPGVLAQAAGGEVSAGNPTDILLEFGGEDLLGISAKSTKGKGDIGFKNPGVGAIGNAVGVDLRGYIQAEIARATEELQLPGTARERKLYLREPANVVVREKAEEIGRNILNMLRERLYEHLQSMNEEQIRQHLTEYWMDAGTNYPYYIKVTGRGRTGKGFSASIDDPVKSEKYKALMSEPIEVVPVGNDSIGIKAGDKRIMKMRFKYESQKLASSLKMSGDPW
jgi:hypothetical protein